MKKVAMNTIGCDLGDRRSELCVVSPDGHKTRPKPIATTAAAFRRWFAGCERAHVVIEVGAHSRWVSALLKGLGHEVTVANPRKVKLISQSLNKTDRHDAQLLARLGRADAELLNPVEHRGEAVQADLAVAKARDALVRMRVRLVNLVRATVKSFGERLPSCTAEAFHRKTRESLPAVLTPALAPLYAVLETLEKQIAEHDALIERLAKQKYPDAQVVGQVYGVGNLTALVYVLTLEDKRRFKTSRSVGAFLGLVPRRDQSGNSDKQLGITKSGDELLRRLLVQCANWIMGPFGKDCDLRRKGEELAKRGGKNARKRAKVAVARKLAVLMHRLWVTGEEYEPLRSTTKVAA